MLKKAQIYDMLTDWTILFTSCLLYKALPSIKINLESKLHTTWQLLDYLDLCLGLGMAAAQVTVSLLPSANMTLSSGHPRIIATCFTTALINVLINCGVKHVALSALCHLGIGIGVGLLWACCVSSSVTAAPKDRAGLCLGLLGTSMTCGTLASRVLCQSLTDQIHWEAYSLLTSVPVILCMAALVPRALNQGPSLPQTAPKDLKPTTAAYSMATIASCLSAVKVAAKLAWQELPDHASG